MLAVGHTAEQKFFADDPLAREPETQDASGAQPWDIDLFYDLSYNLFVTARQTPSGIRAGNVNTIDEVPDSSWFTNRIGSRALTVEEVVRGPVVGPAPAHAKWTLTREKTAGAAPGFTAQDANGQTFFVSFDARANPEGATGAVVVATKIFWALGYNQVEYFLTSMTPESIVIGPSATTRRPSGKRSPLNQEDVREILERADRRPDGSYRVAAGRLLSGKVLGGFKYEGTRPDDPNDLVPHENRRELRALRVFGAWTNLTDMKAGNTLDTIVTEGGRGVVRHYLQDVGSTFGVGANGPHEWNEGWEYIYDRGGTRRRLFTFGLAVSPWQTADYEKHPSIGRFEGEAFDPETWKPRAPTAAYIDMRDDDAFWAARRVMAFSDDLIRAIVKTGEYSDPAAEKYLGDVLIQRRDKIGRAYLREDQPRRRPDARRVRRAVVRQRRRAVRRDLGPARVHRRVAHLRQRDCGDTTSGSDDWSTVADESAGRLARCDGRLHPRRHQCRSSGSSDMEGASASVLSTSGGRLEAGRTGATARLAKAAGQPEGGTLRHDDA